MIEASTQYHENRADWQLAQLAWEGGGFLWGVTLRVLTKSMVYIKVTNLISESLLCIWVLNALLFCVFDWVLSAKGMHCQVNPILKKPQWKVCYYYYHSINFARNRAELWTHILWPQSSGLSKDATLSLPIVYHIGTSPRRLFVLLGPNNHSCPWAKSSVLALMNFLLKLEVNKLGRK